MFFWNVEDLKHALRTTRSGLHVGLSTSPPTPSPRVERGPCLLFIALNNLGVRYENCLTNVIPKLDFLFSG